MVALGHRLKAYAAFIDTKRLNGTQQILLTKNAVTDSANQPQAASANRSGFGAFFRRVVSRAFVAGCWVLAILFALSVLGGQFFIGDVLSNFQFHFLILLSIGLAITLVSRSGSFLPIVLAIAVGWAGFEQAQYWIPVSQPPPGPTKVRLMSFNVLGGNRSFQATIDEINEHDPDVVFLLEYSNLWHDACEPLAEQYPHHVRVRRWHGYGIAMFSKLPINESQIVQPFSEKMDLPVIDATVDVAGQSLRLIAIHTFSPINDFRWKLRNDQLKQVVDVINQGDTATVLVGDFNMGPASRRLDALLASAGLRESRTGFGRQPTWPAYAGPFAVPIDHALVSESVHIHNRFVGDAIGSDHLPIFVDLSIAGTE